MRTINIIRAIFLLVVFLSYGQFINAQSGLEEIIVEKYYVSDANDATDTDGGTLPAGSVTYRVYVDMAPGYELQAVYGNENHDLFFTTTTSFFNNEDRGATTGGAIGTNRLGDNTVALDTYVTMGAASSSTLGVLKEEDLDGSIVGGVNNDGGSAAISGGLLVNTDAEVCVDLTSSDGHISGTLPTLGLSPGLNLSVFNDVNAGPSLLVQGDAWFIAEGVQGPTAENRVLIAQITTDGTLTFQLNIQIGTPTGGVEQYVATNLQSGEFLSAGLTFNSSTYAFGCGGCQVPTDLNVVEIGFSGSNPRVNATWTNPEGTTDCEVRGGRISNSSYTAGEPEFTNIANTQVITQTNGTTVNFNITLFNNPNIPFISGQRYGFDVRCACADGSGYSEWANITPEATFVVPFPQVSTQDLSNAAKDLNEGKLSLNVYPNPTDGRALNFALNLNEQMSFMEFHAKVYDISGKMVLDKALSTASNVDAAVFTLDFEDELNKGMYILMIQNERVSLSSRFSVN